MPVACLYCNASVALDSDAARSRPAMKAGQARRAKELAAFLKSVPEVQYAFAYGSGVFQQQGLYKEGSSNEDRPMLDFILAVDDPVTWHDQVAAHLSACQLIKCFRAFLLRSSSGQ